MPLSEHEQRLLDQIERALYAEDPKFATTVQASDLRTHVRRRLRRGVLLFVLGVVLLLAGVMTQWYVGVVGFLLMLVSALTVATSYKRGTSRPGVSRARLRSVGGTAKRTTRSGRPQRSAGPRSSFMERVEERWRKRWEERDR